MNLKLGKGKGSAAKKTDTKRSRTTAELSHFALGASQTRIPSTYAPEILEAFTNKNPKAEAWTSLVCTEFTSLCPKTGQPDFARIFVNYIADQWMVESKSFKLYLFSFRNHGDFHEDCVQTICDDLFSLLKPKYLEVLGEFTPRGGISIYPFASRANKDKHYQSLYQSRLRDYAPGKFSMPLSRIYG